MKTLPLLLSFFFMTNSAFAESLDSASKTVWIDTNSVLISNMQNFEIARRDCETTSNILRIMSNDKIVFRSLCEPTNNPKCNYYYCYQLNVKALVIDKIELTNE